MKIRHKVSALAASLLAIGTVSLAQAADFTAYSSDSTQVNVGQSNTTTPMHTGTGAGIAVVATGIDKLITVSGLTDYVGADANGVYNLSYGSSLPTDHSTLGVFHFAKVGSSDVWFGEWSQTASASDGTHTVYYVGDSTGTTVPTSGSATYAVKGVSDYGNNGLLSGAFAANFTTGTLRGVISNATSGYAVNIGVASINAANASFSGTGASASVSGASVASGGTVTGNFYGANAASLAGAASFGNHSVYDTAFGGTKN